MQRFNVLGKSLVRNIIEEKRVGNGTSHTAGNSLHGELTQKKAAQAQHSHRQAAIQHED